MQEVQQDMLTTLLAQHRQLKEDLSLVKQEMDNAAPDFSKVVAGLVKFKVDLVKHLELENLGFYPEILKKMDGKKLDTTSTNEFIKQMMDIQKVVLVFLSEYDTEDKIKNVRQIFVEKLNGTISALNFRIESEEEGVYIYWNM